MVIQRSHKLCPLQLVRNGCVLQLAVGQEHVSNKNATVETALFRESRLTADYAVIRVWAEKRKAQLSGGKLVLIVRCNQIAEWQKAVQRFLRPAKTAR